MLGRVSAQVSLTLRPGRLVALVGLSGSGKSTLVALLQRLYDANSGSVGPRPKCAPHSAIDRQQACGLFLPLQTGHMGVCPSPELSV